MSKALRNQFKAMRQGKIPLNKRLILETLQKENIAEKTRASAMATASHFHLTEALPAARDILASNQKYVGSRQAALRAVGELSTHPADLNLLEQLLQTIHQTQPREGHRQNILQTLRVAIDRLSTTQKEEAPATNSAPSPPCCPPELADQWRDNLAGGLDHLEQVLTDIHQQVRQCDNLDKLNEVIGLRFFFGTQSTFFRKNSLTMEQYQVKLSQLVQRILGFIDHCQKRSGEYAR